MTKEANKVIQTVYSEVRFLRELNICQNIITLYSVYRSRDSLHLVLKYAEHGCLQNFIAKEASIIKEVSIRSMMQ